ncbi:MAG: acyl-CoA dehydrogenase family protein [Pseudomonadales bacterium]|jgi:alkylation response protein AidB-like acyl-CoA dehydrogenase|nr:acyl-CoA dehydrogenase family protein [Pseudomonadales bacterium]MDP6470711.1 acyl-CoA dehydrogenase family protein [Pseudomonadales bacterium]MDP6828337.1 acyl-CoA dehydrogenase family protein [Pseudomonadales bacterium]MDP6972113.1 acyl-CoA dehydrogenase family protein [Pseudomonadales bacterium]|tara:strand:+ start:4922 stop:6136 length:1215 start_codon:yes stop_codon:yes gene_type:complete
MDFNDSPAEAAFRDEARTWLEANVPTSEELEGLDYIEQAKLWQKRKYDAGWACIRWPKEYGGRGASAIEQVIFNQEENKFDDLPGGVFLIGQGMAAPTLMTWGKEEHMLRYLPKLASGEEIWCQLFSEPAGGSDLAALRTKAEKDGDEWVINGQKIWTSGAHYSDYGILVVRTDPNVPKHKGLSYFFLDMKSPGVEIKPIKQLSGDANFNEVYFTDVRIPDSQRLGEVGQGWQVAITTLMNERASVGGGGGGFGFDEILALARQVNVGDAPAIEDSAVRAKLADWYCKRSGLKYTGYRSMTALSRGEIPGPENSIGKLVGAPMMQDMASFGMDLLEMTGAIWDEAFAPLTGMIQAAYMGSPGMRIAGGTDEIMANIIAERVLGLPQEPRADKGMPFSDVPTGAG